MTQKYNLTNNNNNTKIIQKFNSTKQSGLQSIVLLHTVAVVTAFPPTLMH